MCPDISGEVGCQSEVAVEVESRSGSVGSGVWDVGSVGGLFPRGSLEDSPIA